MLVGLILFSRDIAYCCELFVSFKQVHHQLFYALEKLAALLIHFFFAYTSVLQLVYVLHVLLMQMKKQTPSKFIICSIQR